MISNNKKIVIATGGTGGHVFPAVGLASFLNNEGYDPILTTDKRGFKFLDKKNYKMTKIINSYPFNKNNKTFSILSTIFAFLKSLLLLLQTRPKFIFGMGGYSSFPVCLAGTILRIPFIIYESNLFMGKANRYLTPFAKKIFVSYRDLKGINEKYEKKIIKIGNILREEILNFKKIESKSLENNLNILVLGGSQAAKVFAEILPSVFIECKRKNINIKVYQQCLDDQRLNLKEKYEKNKINFELFSFTFDIFKYYHLSNLVITRAGASALAEFLNCKIPIISIPLATSSENHQLKNAQYFERKGFGVLVEEKDIKNKLFDLLQSIHKDKSILNVMKINQNKHTDKDVFMIIKKEINKLFYED